MRHPRDWPARVQVGCGGGLIGVYAGLTGASWLVGLALVVGVAFIASGFATRFRR